VSQQYVAENIALRLKQPKIPNNPPKHIDSKIVKKIFNNMSSESLPKYKILYYTGMRPGEMLKLKKGNIDIEKRSILVKSTKTNSYRTIPIHEELIPIFNDILFEKKNDDYLFPSKDDPEQHQTQMRTGLAKTCKKVGSYSLRKTP